MVGMLTTGDVARALGVTINTVKAWIRGGRVQATRLPSGHYRIPEGELDRLLGRRRAGTQSGDEPAAAHRRRRDAWREFERWRLGQPVREMSFHEAVVMAGTMLELVDADVRDLEPAPEEVADRVAGLRRRLRAVVLA